MGERVPYRGENPGPSITGEARCPIVVYPDGSTCDCDGRNVSGRPGSICVERWRNRNGNGSNGGSYGNNGGSNGNDGNGGNRPNRGNSNGDTDEEKPMAKAYCWRDYSKRHKKYYYSCSGPGQYGHTSLGVTQNSEESALRQSGCENPRSGLVWIGNFPNHKIYEGRAYLCSNRIRYDSQHTPREISDWMFKTFDMPVTLAD